MNQEHMQECKNIMVRYQKAGCMLEQEDKTKLEEFVKGHSLDQFSIMATATMLNKYIQKNIDLNKGIEYTCFDMCVNNPFKVQNLIVKSQVKDLDDFYRKINTYLCKAITGGYVQ